MLNVKRLAFTLAEVLIVIGIIGIVAEMVIPGVVADTQKQITVAKVKEVYSILSQATNQINLNCSGAIINCLTNPNAPLDDVPTSIELTNLYKQKLYVVKDCTDGSTTGCFANVTYKVLKGTNYINLVTYAGFTNSRIVLKNGIAVEFEWGGLGNAISVLVDVNNEKPPNQMGKDTFYFINYTGGTAYTPNVLLPFPNNDCVTTNGGFGCSAKILQESAINYY